MFARATRVAAGISAPVGLREDLGLAEVDLPKEVAVLCIRLCTYMHMIGSIKRKKLQSCADVKGRDKSKRSKVRDTRRIMYACTHNAYLYVCMYMRACLHAGTSRMLDHVRRPRETRCVAIRLILSGSTRQIICTAKGGWRVGGQREGGEE